MRGVSADEQGKSCRSYNPEGINWLLRRAKVLNVKDSPPEPLILGRHLIDIGVKPGKCFGLILSKCYEAQLEGLFDDLADGKKYAANLIIALGNILNNRY